MSRLSIIFNIILKDFLLCRQSTNNLIQCTPQQTKNIDKNHSIFTLLPHELQVY